MQTMLSQLQRSVKSQPGLIHLDGEKKMKISPISDADASVILGVTYTTIRNAVRRGSLTRLRSAGQVQHVAREQVELFRGKRYIVLDELSGDELRTWQSIHDAITTPAPQVDMSKVRGAGVFLLLYILASLSDKPDEQEIEKAVAMIPDPAQRKAIRSLIADANTRAKLQELAIA